MRDEAEQHARNGSGLEVDLHPDRALDLGQATAWGVPLAWLSPTGFPGRVAYEPAGLGWLDTFGGGLLTTCGLDTFGSTSTDDGEEYGLHGRITTIPARLHRAEVTSRAVVVEGDVHQVRALGQHLDLRRRVQMPLGEPRITVRDTVTNLGTTDAAHMILYHCDLGWPLIDTSAELHIPSSSVQPRDEDARQGLSTWNRIEPANCATLLGRHDARTRGMLSTLGAGESVHYDLEFDADQLPDPQ